MTRLFLIFLLLLFPVFLIAQDNPQVESTVFFIGDCGEPTAKNDPIGKVLRREVALADTNSAVLFLGDNVYPFGIAQEGGLGRKRAEEILESQASWVDSLKARGIFIPGNHDWQHWNRNGWEFVINQQLFIDSLKSPYITFLPKGGCPGPVEIHLTANTVLIIIDSQWLLHAYDKPGEGSDCFTKDPATLMTMLDDAFFRNRGKRVIVAGHHPVISYGDHGGIFAFQDHVFPFVDLERHLYIPLPIIGSLYPLYRSVIGHPQDIKHPNYTQFAALLMSIMARHPGSVYAAGHEHALEHIVRDSVQYIVSGSGSKTGHVRKGKYAHYADGVRGFVKLIQYTNGKARLEFWQVDNQNEEGKIVHEELIPSARSLQQQPRKEASEKVASVKIRASSQYVAGRGKKFFLGANYRDAWNQEVEVPVFYVGEEKGGLKVLQKGGGMQTLSLRLIDSLGREYVLRSVNKNPEKALPEMFRKTFAKDVVQDQISASHPYAALIVPLLAEAAGIYHTNPRLVYVPDDPGLGIYRDDFANTLALFEERPDEDQWSDKAYFGNSKNIVNTSKVLERLQRDGDNQVDQKFVVRSRLFDMWIGDWDRHDDQWRWAMIEDGKKEIYRPIPRDRDQAFFVNEGALAKVWSRKWAMPKFEGFDDEINWPPGLSFNARYFDRSFLNEVDEDTWVDQAMELRRALTDTLIEAAVKRWPKEIYDLDGEEIIGRLKARRDRLVETALEHYRFLAQQVDIVGTDKKERFEVKRKEDGDVEVEVFKINKEGKASKKFYDRHFKIDETDEINIYGLGEDDQFIVEGSVPKSILVRMIGGKGRDSVVDVSNVTGLARKTQFYDLAQGNTIKNDGELRDRTSSDLYVNDYNRKSFKYNRVAPLIYGNLNPDDGLFIGGGVLIQHEGFRKQPFKDRHIIVAAFAPRTSSYNFLYRGDFTDVIGQWGIGIDADIKSPNFVNNFFGLGNETDFDQDIDDTPGVVGVDEAIDYYRFRFQEVRLAGYFTRSLMNTSRFSIGPAFQRVEVEDPGNDDRFIGEYSSTLDYNLFEEDNYYAGIAANFLVDNRDDPRLTTRGVVLALNGRAMKGLDDRANDVANYEAALSLYQSFNVPKGVTFAGRVGGGRVFGNYDFYQSEILSGRTEIRGYRKTRFYGDRKFYANFEVRAKLINVRTYLFPASFGILAFHDLGRVWYTDATGIDPSAGGTSDKWHKGWGGGIWFTPFNFSVLSLELGHSEEGTLGYIRLGFLF
jgi:hypothetical protein